MHNKSSVVAASITIMALMPIWGQVQARETKTAVKKPSPSPSASAIPTASPEISAKTPKTLPAVDMTRNKDGAQFIYSASTGMVTLTTPTGNTHTLKLPETAIANMFRTGILIDDSDDEASDAASPSPSPSPKASPSPSVNPSSTPSASPVATSSANINESEILESYESSDPNGDIILTQIVRQPKKLLGIIPVKIKKTLKINEMTGETSEITESSIAKLLSFLLTN